MSELTDLKAFVDSSAVPLPKVKKVKGAAINTGTSPAYRTIKIDAEVNAFIKKLGFRFNQVDITSGSNGPIAMELIPLKKTPVTPAQAINKAAQLEKFFQKKVSAALIVNPVAATVRNVTYQGLLASYGREFVGMAERKWIERLLDIVEKAGK